MSAAALLSELRRRAIELRAEGSELRASAPAGALTPELCEELKRHKADLLALLTAAQALTGAQRAIVPLQRNGERAPIYGVPGHNGDVFCYRVLARELGAGQPFYGLQPPGLDGQAEPLARIEELVAYFAAQIRAFEPAPGPCVIAGFCAGGAVAVELARSLAAGGAEVRFVALFGCPYPDYFRRRTQPSWQFAQQLARAAKHARELLSRSWSERQRYIVAELAERDARLRRLSAEARDPVLARRAKVEQATLAAVCAHTPRPFAGRVKLFLPGSAWLRSGAAPLDWRALAGELEAHFGPDEASGSDMLREPHAAAFAELFRRAY